MVPFKNPRNLLWAFAVNAEVKDALDNLGSILIQNPLVLAAARCPIWRVRPKGEWDT